MNGELTKAQRRRLRELGGIAYERDLSGELAKLESEFKRWRGGQISPFELSDTIIASTKVPPADSSRTTMARNWNSP